MFAQLGLIVRKICASLVLLHVIGKAAVHRISPSVDDLGVGQHALDQPHIPPIRWVLVGKERAIRESRALRQLDVPAAKMAKLLVRQTVNDFLRRLVRMLSPELPFNLVEREQFLRALDLGMARQNLLDQGGSGARQSDDEDRIRPRVSGTRMSEERLRRVDPAQFANARSY